MYWPFASYMYIVYTCTYMYVYMYITVCVCVCVCVCVSMHSCLIWGSQGSPMRRMVLCSPVRLRLATPVTDNIPTSMSIILYACRVIELHNF